MEQPQQPLLLDKGNVTVDLKSPIFKGRPGWGGQLAAWLAKIGIIKTIGLVIAATLTLWGVWLFFTTPW